jgi:uncharacterized phage protein gp47/JayE
MIYSCCSDVRKGAVLGNPSVNGIDFLEVLDEEAVPLGSPRQRTLLVHCLNPLTLAAWTPDNVMIGGGESVTSIAVDWVEPALPGSPSETLNSTFEEQAYFAALTDADKVLVVRTHVAGDFSTYTLRLVNSAIKAAGDPFSVTEVLAGFDSQLSEVDFSFKVECPPYFDCAPQVPACPPAPVVPPPINYLAKDYGSFRTTMLDRLSQLLPGWASTSEADLGVVLAELIAYAGDHLSYQQDAVATEAYLETARRRVSLRRHALLVDYTVHDGSNARAWIQLQVDGDGIFLGRATTRFYTYAPGMPASLAVGAGNEEAAIMSGVQVFQPMQDAVLYGEQNQMSFYTWGDTGCCLPMGATEATLLGSLVSLRPGDVLIFQEIVGPKTGNPADADIRHRCAVRLTQVATRDGQGNPLQDSLFDSANPVLVTEIQWSQDDALPFPLCLSSSFIDSNDDTQAVAQVSVAYGNVVLADHGLSLAGRSLGTVPQPRLFLPPDPAADRCQPQAPTPVPARYGPAIPDSPITQAVPLPLAGSPLTPAVVPLSGTGFVSLTDSGGFVSLMIQADEPRAWPQYFGVVLTPTGATFDLSVVYNPPGGAAGASAPVVLEDYPNISLNPADLAGTASQINLVSRLIRVGLPATLPGVPAKFKGATFMLPNSGTVNVKGPTSASPVYLTLQATNPASWPGLFGILAQGIQQAPQSFNLLVVYNPSSGGVGVDLPVTIERFAGLSLATEGQISLTAGSQLISVWNFSQAPNPALSACDLMNFDPGDAVPVISLEGTFDGATTPWTIPSANSVPQKDMLESAESDQVFVVEVESDGTATLRFGDDTNGRRPDSGTSFVASYRIGNGTAGNVGADSLIHFATDAPIQSCRNPLPASGGTDPETNDQIRRRAPQAFLTQERAVTMADYEGVTEANPLVDRAAASMRWTGSWYTVFVAVEPQGAGILSQKLANSLQGSVGAYRLAGQDLEFDSPQYVSLELTLAVCVDPGYFQLNVKQALLQVLSSQVMPNGQKGLFYPDNFTFGQTVYLSPIYAAARSVAGVLTVNAVVFQPQGTAPTTAFVTAGEIKLGPLQVARLANDPDFPDRGQITLNMEGGK